MNSKYKGIKFLFNSSHIVSVTAWIWVSALCGDNNSKPSIIFRFWFVDDILLVLYSIFFIVIWLINYLTSTSLYWCIHDFSYNTELNFGCNELGVVDTLCREIFSFETIGWFTYLLHSVIDFLRNNYNILLTSQLEPFLLYTPKHFVHGEVPIQDRKSVV